MLSLLCSLSLIDLVVQRISHERVALARLKFQAGVFESGFESGNTHFGLESVNLNSNLSLRPSLWLLGFGGWPGFCASRNCFFGTIAGAWAISVIFDHQNHTNCVAVLKIF